MNESGGWSEGKFEEMRDKTNWQREQISRTWREKEPRKTEIVTGELY